MIGLAALAIPLASGCGPVQSAIDPAGPRAELTAGLWWTTVILGGAIWLLVLALLGRGVMRGVSLPPGPGGGVLFVLAGGAALPVLVTGGLWLYSSLTLRALSAPAEEPAVVIEIVGHQWWWEARYPDLGVVTANEIHVPAGRPVQLRLTTDDVIHSFWVPRLAGKIDLFPGRETALWIEAVEPGSYRGQCAEFCGLQHARMAFHVVAQPPGEFERWAATQAEPAAEPQGELVQAGQRVFMESGCGDCHSVRGTPADGTLAPDLTHVASREWIAAGTLPMTRGSVAGWVIDPQRLKPGVLMPSFRLSPEALQALLDYLMSLE